MADILISRRRAALLAGGVAALGAWTSPLRAEPAADPFQDLLDDHRRVQEVLAQMQQTSDSATADRMRLLGDLKRELVRHAAVEEYVLYPAFGQNPANKRTTADLFTEHGEVKTLLYELELTPRSDVRWIQKAGDLAKLLERHQRREEEDIFPRHRASLNRTELEFLSQLAQRERDQA